MSRVVVEEKSQLIYDDIGLKKIGPKKQGEKEKINF